MGSASILLAVDNYTVISLFKNSYRNSNDLRYNFNSKSWSPLGYGYKTVDRAVQKQVLEIDTGTGPSARMVELAETLVKLKNFKEPAMFGFYTCFFLCVFF